MSQGVGSYFIVAQARWKLFQFTAIADSSSYYSMTIHTLNGRMHGKEEASPTDLTDSQRL